MLIVEAVHHSLSNLRSSSCSPAAKAASTGRCGRSRKPSAGLLFLPNGRRRRLRVPTGRSRDRRLYLDRRQSSLWRPGRARSINLPLTRLPISATIITIGIIIGRVIIIVVVIVAASEMVIVGVCPL